MSMTDYDSTLGIERHATQEDVRSAYRRMAMKWHPDRHLVPTSAAQLPDFFLSHPKSAILSVRSLALEKGDYGAPRRSARS